MKRAGDFLKNAVWLSVACILCVFLSVPGVASCEEDSVVLHVVKGDTLIHICRKYLEKPGMWREVAKFNSLKNPDLIFPDERLKIPVRLMPGVPLDGTVTFVHGDGKVQKQGETGWAPLSPGDPVPRGSRVRTGKASTVEITFEDKSSIFIKPETTLDIAASEKRGSLFSLNRFYLSIGRAVARLKAATGSSSRMEIQTPSAIASVRGTEFRVSADKQEATRTEVLTGTVGVSAMDTTVSVKEGEGTYVGKGAAPVPPRRLLPPPGLRDHRPLYKDLPLRFTFNETAGLASVRGFISKDRAGTDILDEKVVPSGKPLEFINLPDGVYYLSAQSIDNLGIEGFQSEPWQIKLRANPLPPLIRMKDDDAEFVGKSAGFNWLKVKDAAMYHIQIGRDSAFTALLEEKTDYRDESFDTAALDHGLYYFRISSVGPDGYEAGWSQTIAFRLIPPPPAPPLEKPAVGENSILLKWRNLGEGITYHFQAAKDQEFRQIIVDKRLAKSEVSFEKPKDPGQYYVRTSSIDRKNREGRFSPPQSFEVESSFPYGLFGSFGAAVGIILLLGP